MAEKLPRVCVFGATGLVLTSGPDSDLEANALDTSCYRDDTDLDRILAEDDPDVIVTIGEVGGFPLLHLTEPEVRRRWIHFDSADDVAAIGEGAFHCFVTECLQERTDLPPLVSVITPTYHTGQLIERPYNSLRGQSYPNWEWILVDDSDDNGETFRMLSDMAHRDHRLGVFRHHEHSGVIGKVKRWACRLANGQILVELDHDDEITPRALEYVVEAFRHFDGSTPDRPLAGFVYTDFAEIYPDGSPVTYSDDWAFGYGSYRWETIGDYNLAVANSPNVNPKTIRHIVGVPNHLRCWDRDCYQDIGGHSPRIHVADDYELLLRTFLDTRMVRVPELGYIQWRNQGGAIKAGNTHQERNKEIQRLVRAFSQDYDRRIHERFLELGVDDFVWAEGRDSFSRLNEIPNPADEPHCTLLLPG